MKEWPIEIKNARIRETMLGIEDHGIMMFWLMLDYDGGGQGAGGYCLDGYDMERKKRKGHASSILLIRRTLEVIGVENWEDLKGKYIRVKADHNKVHAIGNIIKDEWLDFENFFTTEEAK